MSLGINGLPALVVARPGPWGNPYRPGTEAATRAEAVAMFSRDLHAIIAKRGLQGKIEELRGKNLACWCRPIDACHADVLLQFVNA